MPFAVIEALSALTAVTLIGSFILIGMKMRWKHKETQLGSAGRDEIDRLTEAVDTLGDQVEHLTTETADLHERLDFAERLLTKPAETEPSSTPT
jgi:hypothetical protein